MKIVIETLQSKYYLHSKFINVAAKSNEQGCDDGHLENCLIQDAVDLVKADEVGKLEEDIAEKTGHDETEGNALRVVDNCHQNMMEWGSIQNS